MTFPPRSHPATQPLTVTKRSFNYVSPTYDETVTRHVSRGRAGVGTTPARKPRVGYCVGGGRSYLNWTQCTSITDRMEDADFVFWTGGQDIGALLYSTHVHPTTSGYCYRDRHEIAEYHKAVALGKPLFGTCRGIQFLAAMAGAQLVQHQDNPHFMHDVVTHDGLTLPMSSCHHQACWPWLMNPADYQVLAWAKERQSEFHENGLQQEMITGPENEKMTGGLEIEAIFFPKIKAYGWQGHAEMIYGEQRCEATIAYMQAQLDRFLASNGTSVDEAVAPATVVAPTPSAPIPVTA